MKNNGKYVKGLNILYNRIITFASEKANKELLRMQPLLFYLFCVNIKLKDA